MADLYHLAASAFAGGSKSIRFGSYVIIERILFTNKSSLSVGNHFFPRHILPLIYILGWKILLLI